MHSEYEEIVSIVPPIPRRSTRKSMILHHVYSSFSFLFFLLFFSSPNFFYSFFFIFFFFFVSNPLPISRRDTRIPVIYMEKVDGCSWIRAKFVRFCSDFMNVSRRALPPSLPVPDDAVSGEN